MIEVKCCVCGKTWQKEGYSGGIVSHSYCDGCARLAKAEIAEERRAKTDPNMLLNRVSPLPKLETPEPAPIPMIARSNDSPD
jgi:hypothetical protein